MFCAPKCKASLSALAATSSHGTRYPLRDHAPYSRRNTKAWEAMSPSKGAYRVTGVREPLRELQIAAWEFITSHLRVNTILGSPNLRFERPFPSVGANILYLRTYHKWKEFVAAANGGQLKHHNPHMQRTRPHESTGFHFQNRSGSNEA